MRDTSTFHALIWASVLIFGSGSAQMIPGEGCGNKTPFRFSEKDSPLLPCTLVLPEHRERFQEMKAAIPTWHFEPWTECSATCDSGEHSRTRTCRNATHEVDPSLCGGGPLSFTKGCRVRDCIYYHWGSWTEWSNCIAVPRCSGSEGIKSRTRQCLFSATGDPVSDVSDCEQYDPEGPGALLNIPCTTIACNATLLAVPTILRFAASGGYLNYGHYHTTTDGDTDPGKYIESVSHADAWYQLDLFYSMYITKLHVVSRNLPLRFANLEFRIGNNDLGLNRDFEANPVCYTMTAGQSYGFEGYFECTPIAYGKYVTMKRYETNPLDTNFPWMWHLAEVQVFVADNYYQEQWASWAPSTLQQGDMSLPMDYYCDAPLKEPKFRGCINVLDSDAVVDTSICQDNYPGSYQELDYSEMKALEACGSGKCTYVEIERDLFTASCGNPTSSPCPNVIDKNIGTYTELNHADSWKEIDMVTTRQVDRVVLIGRVNRNNLGQNIGYVKRLTNLEIRIGDTAASSDHKANPLCLSFPRDEICRASNEITVDCEMSGRFVVVSKTAPTPYVSAYATVWHLAEVIVYRKVEDCSGTTDGCGEKRLDNSYFTASSVNNPQENNDYINGDTGFHLEINRESFWYQVDMHAHYEVTKLKLYHRTSVSNRFNGFEMRVGNVDLTRYRNMDSNSLCKSVPAVDCGCNDMELICDTPIYGRYVIFYSNIPSLDSSFPHVVNIAEIYTYAMVRYNKLDPSLMTASAGGADLGTDLTDGDMTTEYETHNGNMVITVDLGQVSKVVKLKLFTSKHQPLCNQRYYVSTTAGDTSSGAICYQIPFDTMAAWNNNLLEVYCTSPKTGRYLMIRRYEDTCFSGTISCSPIQIMHYSDIEVYSHVPSA